MKDQEVQGMHGERWGRKMTGDWRCLRIITVRAKQVLCALETTEAFCHSSYFLDFLKCIKSTYLFI